mmetsp:Transcript_23856/g.66170  ORF Transcript_23856/g.66170 Transcript_23856/m.66170 type:complete len:252 (+) Transcript_23856:382-1137(+)
MKEEQRRSVVPVQEAQVLHLGDLEGLLQVDNVGGLQGGGAGGPPLAAAHQQVQHVAALRGQQCQLLVEHGHRRAAPLRVRDRLWGQGEGGATLRKGGVLPGVQADGPQRAGGLVVLHQRRLGLPEGQEHRVPLQAPLLGLYHGEALHNTRQAPLAGQLQAGEIHVNLCVQRPWHPNLVDLEVCVLDDHKVGDAKLPRLGGCMVEERRRAVRDTRWLQHLLVDRVAHCSHSGKRSSTSRPASLWLGPRFSVV